MDLMSSGGREDRYIGTDAEQGVLLPYRDGRLAFLALMPSQGTPLGEYLDTLDGAALAGLITGAGTEYFTLRLPKFEMMWSGSLVGALQAMGLTDAFDPDAADFAPMGRDAHGNPLYISAVEHGAGIEVDEQGTRAFSFTFIGMSGAGAAPRRSWSLTGPSSTASWIWSGACPCSWVPLRRADGKERNE